MEETTVAVAGVEDAMEDLTIETDNRPSKRLRTGENKPDAPPRPINLKFKMTTNTEDKDSSQIDRQQAQETASAMMPAPPSQALQLRNQDYNMVPSVQSENDRLRAYNTSLNQKVKGLEKSQRKQQKQIEGLQTLYKNLEKQINDGCQASKVAPEAKAAKKSKAQEDTFASISVTLVIPTNNEDDMAVDAAKEDTIATNSQKEVTMVINGQSAKTLHKLWRTVSKNVATDSKQSMEAAVEAGTARKVEMHDSKDKADFTTTIGTGGSDRMYYEWFTRNVWNVKDESVDLKIVVGEGGIDD